MRSCSVLLWMTGGVNAVIYAYLAYMSRTWDWHFSHNLSEIFYSGVVWFGEFPWFSYMYNGGSYLFQHPENFCWSPETIPVLLLGPYIGLRFTILMWCVIGMAGCYLWLRDKIGEHAAIIAANAWVLSLAFFWRVSVGNYMFVWNMILPFMLKAVDRINGKSMVPGCALGVLWGMIVLSPSAASIVFFVFPAFVAYLIISLVSTKWRQCIPVFCTYALSMLMALVIALPKLYSAIKLFSLQRVTALSGTSSFKDIAGFLFSPAYTSIANVCTRIDAINICEASVALMPVYSVLACVGMILGLFKARQLRLYGFSCVLMLCGIGLAGVPVLWEALHNTVANSLRCPQRFLGLASFGLVLFAGLGFECVSTKLPKARLALTVLVLLLGYVSVGLWIYRAETGIFSSQRISMPVVGRRVEKSNIKKVLMHKRYSNDIIKGYAICNAVDLVGNEGLVAYPPAGVFSQVNAITGELFQAYNYACISSEVRHTAFSVYAIPPSGRVRVNLRPTVFGERVEIWPKNSIVFLERHPNYFEIENRGPCNANVRISPVFPMPEFVICMSGGAYMLCIYVMWSGMRTRLAKRRSLQSRSVHNSHSDSNASRELA